LALKELGAAMTRLPADQREALVMVVVHGMSYEDLAEATGCAVGTAKSRVFRARRQLEAWLIGETKERGLRPSRTVLVEPSARGARI
jgi:RNA polymerase sigma-70 factor (ECF subfamily)